MAALAEPTEWRGGGKLADFEPAMQISQIARALGVTERCVELNLASGLRKLREGLADWRDNEGVGSRQAVQTPANTQNPSSNNVDINRMLPLIAR